MLREIEYRDNLYYPLFSACPASYDGSAEYQFYTKGNHIIEDDDILYISVDGDDMRIIPGYFAYEALTCALHDVAYGYLGSEFNTSWAEDYRECVMRDYPEDDGPLFI